MKFSDKRIMSFDDPRCLTNRTVRHAEERRKAQDYKRSVALVPMSQTWRAILWRLFQKGLEKGK